MSHFVVHHMRDGSLLERYFAPNTVTNEGLKESLSLFMFKRFTDGSTKGVPRLGLIDGSSFTTVDPTDVVSNHAGWLEYPHASPFRSIFGTTVETLNKLNTEAGFTFVATGGSIRGFFVTMGNSDRFFWATGVFSGGSVALLENDSLIVKYTAIGTPIGDSDSCGTPP